jgi:hypothetical protein
MCRPMFSTTTSGKPMARRRSSGRVLGSGSTGTEDAGELAGDVDPPGAPAASFDADVPGAAEPGGCPGASGVRPA